MKKVSVIMGVYNCADTLQRAIDSIRNQTYTNWEFIICDDASTDSTAQIVKENAGEDSRIIFLQNETNMGLAASLNRCLSVAVGDYVARMDGDDASVNTRFEKQVNFLNEHEDIACVGSSVHIVTENGVHGIRYARENVTAFLPGKGTPFAHPTIMMRREVYQHLQGYTVSPRTRRCEDVDLWFRFFSIGCKGYNLQEPLLYYTETREAYRKRSFKSAIQSSIVCYQGYKRLSRPWWEYIYCLKPILVGLMPKCIVCAYHRFKDNS